MYSLKKYYPVKTNDLIRVGRNRDGGYVINKRVINATEILVGLGISIDWTFEESFKQKNKNIKIFAFDYSVSPNIFLKKAKESFAEIFKTKQPDPQKSTNKLKRLLYPLLYLKTAFMFKNFFNNGKNNFFFKEGIDKTKHDLFITVDEMFSKIFGHNSIKQNSVFLKIDIEISEYDVLPLILKYSGYINSMVIEFHKLQKHWSAFESIINELMHEYEVVHIHGNNFAGYISATKTPDCIEITITKKILISNEELAAVNTQTYPVKQLDYACNNKLEDIQIGFD